jgi:SAM-dependent methyltransferase
MFEGKKEFYSDKEVISQYSQMRYGGFGGEYVLSRELDLIASLFPNEGLALDVPCGYGRVTARLAAKGLKVFGLDYSPEMLKMFQNETGKNPVRGDIAQLPIKPESLDMVASIRFLHHYQDLEFYLTHLAAVLKNGGSLAFETYRWSPKAFSFVNALSKGGRVYLHNPETVRAVAEKLSLTIEVQKSAFLLSPFIYRFLPKFLVLILDRIEKRISDSFKTVVFWKLVKY